MYIPIRPRRRWGLGAGDVIKSINGVAVSDLSALVSQVSPWVIDPVVVVENQFRRPPQRREIEYKGGKIPPIGIIPTPPTHSRDFMLELRRARSAIGCGSGGPEKIKKRK